MTKLSTHIPLEYVKQNKKLQQITTKHIYIEYDGEKTGDHYIDIRPSYGKEEDKEILEDEGHYINIECYPRLTIADIIDNAEMLFGESGYYSDGKFTGIITMREAYRRVEEFEKGLLFECHEETAVDILKICQQDKSIEEISEYIINNIK